MIITLSGKVAHKEADLVIVETGGIGYRVYLPGAAADKLETGGTVRLWVYEHIREDAHELFGFAALADLRLFEKIVGVSGIGPKMAMGVMAIGTAAEIEKIIERGDIDRLSRVPRIGKKTAQKIILELKGKLVEGGMGDGEQEEVITALVDLGYQRDKTRQAVRAVSDKEKTDEGRLRAALRLLAK